jgi:RimJ/RimL family protein N-acetyltransferase
MSIPTLRTERLILREWRESDLIPHATMSVDPEVMEPLGGVTDQAQSDSLARACQAQFAARGFALWVVELPGIADFIGLAGLGIVPSAMPFAPAIEIGWRFARRYWGHGYATEAAKAALEDGFVRLGLDEIVAYTRPSNRRSRAVMERLGMQHDINDEFNHPDVVDETSIHNRVLYRMPRQAWQL